MNKFILHVGFSYDNGSDIITQINTLSLHFMHDLLIIKNIGQI